MQEDSVHHGREGIAAGAGSWLVISHPLWGSRKPTERGSSSFSSSPTSKGVSIFPKSVNNWGPTVQTVHMGLYTFNSQQKVFLICNSLLENYLRPHFIDLLQTRYITTIFSFEVPVWGRDVYEMTGYHFEELFKSRKLNMYLGCILKQGWEPSWK